MKIEKFTKKDMTNLMRKDLQLTQDKADEIFNYFVYQVREALMRGEAVYFMDLGVFKVSGVRARIGRNPKTGDAIEIAAFKKVNFKQGASLKAALNPADSE